MRSYGEHVVATILAVPGSSTRSLPGTMDDWVGARCRRCLVRRPPRAKFTCQTAAAYDVRQSEGAGRYRPFGSCGLLPSRCGLSKGQRKKMEPAHSIQGSLPPPPPRALSARLNLLPRGLKGHLRIPPPAKGRGPHN